MSLALLSNFKRKKKKKGGVGVERKGERDGQRKRVLRLGSGVLRLLEHRIQQGLHVWHACSDIYNICWSLLKVILSPLNNGVLARPRPSHFVRTSSSNPIFSH